MIFLLPGIKEHSVEPGNLFRKLENLNQFINYEASRYWRESSAGGFIFWPNVYKKAFYPQAELKKMAKIRTWLNDLKKRAFCRNLFDRSTSVLITHLHFH